MLLAEDHIAVGAVVRPPVCDAPLQGPPHAGRELGMAAANLLEDRHRAQLGCRLQHRHDLAVPYERQRVGTAASAPRLLLRRQPRIGFDPIGTGGGKPGLRGIDNEAGLVRLNTGLAPSSGGWISSEWPGRA